MKSKTIYILAVSFLVASAATSKAESLYKKYGVHKLTAAVYAIVDAHTSNEKLLENAKFRMATEGFPKPAIKFAVANWVMKNLGGPQVTGTMNIGSITKYFNFQGEQLLEFKKVMVDEFEKAGITREDSVRISDSIMRWASRSKTIDELPKGETFKKTDSLYAKLGGIVPISMVVDEFANRLAKDPVVLGNPNVVKALTDGDVSIAGIKYLVTEQVAAAAGGPYKYTGRTMKESHKGLMITESEWQSSAAIMKSVLDDFKVPADLQAQIFAILQSTKKDIVKG